MILTRTVTILIGGPLVLGSVLCPIPAVFQSVVLLCGLLALYEFYRMASFTRREILFGMLAGGAHLAAILFLGAGTWAFAEIACLVFAVFLFLLGFHRDPLTGAAESAGLLLLGIIYVATLFSFLGQARTLSHGIFWVFVILLGTWANDTFAYLFGHWWGAKKLAPQISPGKSVEGFLGGFLGTAAAVLVLTAAFENRLGLAQAMSLVVLIGLAAPLGDLAESLIKRGFQVKDSGRLIPGHGGMLDRIDALIFTAPVVYYYALWLG